MIMKDNYRSNWDWLKATSSALNETNDCTVKALVVATGETYQTIHAAMAERGRKRRQGASMYDMKKAAYSLGYIMEPDDDLWKNIYQQKGSRLTPISAPKWLPANRTFILEMKSHVAGMYKGRVIDWTDARKKIITRIWRVTKRINRV